MVIHDILTTYGIYHCQLTMIFFLQKKKNYDILTQLLALSSFMKWADYWWALELKSERVGTLKLWVFSIFFYTLHKCLLVQ